MTSPVILEGGRRKLSLSDNHRCQLLPTHPLPSSPGPVYWKTRPWFLHPEHRELSSLAQDKIEEDECQGIVTSDLVGLCGGGQL